MRSLVTWQSFSPDYKRNALILQVATLQNGIQMFRQTDNVIFRSDFWKLLYDNLDSYHEKKDIKGAIVFLIILKLTNEIEDSRIYLWNFPFCDLKSSERAEKAEEIISLLSYKRFQV